MVHGMRAAGQMTRPGEPVQAGESTFEAFFRGEHPRLKQALFAVTGSDAEAEEIAQEALLRVWERWDRVSRMENPTGYLYRTALNAHRSRLRSAARSLRRAGQRVRARDEDRLRDVEEEDRVSRAMSQLPLRQRSAIVLVEFLQFDSTEAGAILGVSPTTVRNLAAQARANLKRSLEDRDG